MALYDDIGKSYSLTRRAEPQFAAGIALAVADAQTIVNVGAGTGSYEPPQTIVAVEPSRVMIQQRPPDKAKAVQGVAEKIPLRDKCADSAMAILTVHHWNDVTSGVKEMHRIARNRLVFVTYIPNPGHYWLLKEYFPEAGKIANNQAVPTDRLTKMANSFSVRPLPVPHNCVDGFGAAYWRRPEAYLQPEIRAGISMFAKLPPGTIDSGLNRLRQDLQSGRWHEEHADLLTRESLDVGYRIVTVDV